MQVPYPRYKKAAKHCSAGGTDTGSTQHRSQDTVPSGAVPVPLQEPTVEQAPCAGTAEAQGGTGYWACVIPLLSCCATAS